MNFTNCYNKNVLEMEIRLLKDERAVIAGDYLVIADLHIGYEKSAKERGYVVPNQRKDFLKRIKILAEKNNLKKIILLGDIKHSLPYASEREKYAIPEFFRELSKMFEHIFVIKGNHDGQIEKMIYQKNIEVLPELILENVGFVHGHRKFSEKILGCEIIFMAHAHPAFKIKESSGVRHGYPCWLMGKISRKKLGKETKNERIIVVPSFNPLVYGQDKIAGPAKKFLRIEEILLLDLTKVR